MSSILLRNFSPLGLQEGRQRQSWRQGGHPSLVWGAGNTQPCEVMLLPGAKGSRENRLARECRFFRQCRVSCGTHGHKVIIQGALAGMK